MLYKIIKKEVYNIKTPSRIKPFLKELAKYWMKYPDLRFGQLVCNFTKGIREDGDAFNIEDNIFLRQIIKENNTNKGEDKSE
jgi:uncharacterized protein YihD (DUF1040 family)